ncbi:MAG: alpha/beta hydrolase [Bacteroidetes bacterium]|nr:alpha/beta hydrolase [Bacteroidota bacterium]
MPQLDVATKTIFYKKTGQGVPVILLHGFGEDSRIWNGVVKSLKKKYLVIAPDLPGSGHSQMLDGEVDLLNYAEVILKVIQEEIGHRKKFHLIGHSMGGYISLALAKKYPDYIKSLCLFHSSSFADDAEKIKKRQKSIQFIKKNGSRKFLETTTPDLFSEISKAKNPHLPAKLTDLAASILPEALTQYYRAMINREDTSTVLQSAKFPVLFLLGKYDKAVPLEAGLKQCHLPAISAVHILKSSAHIGMWEQPQKSIGILNTFLEG